MRMNLQQHWGIPILRRMKPNKKRVIDPTHISGNRYGEHPPLQKGDRGGFFDSQLATKFTNISLMGLLAVAILATSCAPARPYRPRPIERYPSAPDPITTPPPADAPRASQPTPQDAIDCERQAAMAGAGSKAAVFNECMRSRTR